MKKTTIYERIKHITTAKGLKNMPALAIHLGYKTPEKLYRLKRDPKAKPSLEIIEDIANSFKDLNIRWLVTGAGKPFAKE